MPLYGFSDRDEQAGSHTLSGGTLALNFAGGRNFAVTLDQNVTDITVSGAPAEWFGVTLQFTQDATGGRSITWPAAWEFEGGTAPSLTTTAGTVSTVVAYSPDGGTTFYGKSAGDAWS